VNCPRNVGNVGKVLWVQPLMGNRYESGRCTGDFHSFANRLTWKGRHWSGNLIGNLSVALFGMQTKPQRDHPGNLFNCSVSPHAIECFLGSRPRQRAKQYVLPIHNYINKKRCRAGEPRLKARYDSGILQVAVAKHTQQLSVNLAQK